MVWPLKVQDASDVTGAGVGFGVGVGAIGRTGVGVGAGALVPLSVDTVAVRAESTVVACVIACPTTCCALSPMGCGSEGLELTNTRSERAVCRRTTSEANDMQS